MVDSKKRSQTTTCPASSAGRMTSSTICARLAMKSSISARIEIGDCVAVHHDGPQTVAQRRAARLAARHDVESSPAKPVGQPRRLRRLAPTVRTVQHQEESGMGMDPVCRDSRSSVDIVDDPPRLPLDHARAVTGSRRLRSRAPPLPPTIIPHSYSAGTPSSIRSLGPDRRQRVLVSDRGPLSLHLDRLLLYAGPRHLGAGDLGVSRLLLRA